MWFLSAVNCTNILVQPTRGWPLREQRKRQKSLWPLAGGPGSSRNRPGATAVAPDVLRPEDESAASGLAGHHFSISGGAQPESPHTGSNSLCFRCSNV